MLVITDFQRHTLINNVICHGIPSEDKVLKDGDIINIDITVIYEGWHGYIKCMIRTSSCTCQTIGQVLLKNVCTPESGR